MVRQHDYGNCTIEACVTCFADVQMAFRLPARLRHELRVRASLRETPTTQILQNLIREYLKREGERD